MKSGILAALAILATSVVAADAASRSHVTVYKTPSCGCCEAWSKALEKAGYDVERHDMEDLSDVRRLATVPAGVEGCHTAALDGYFLEGHVPLAAMQIPILSGRVFRFEAGQDSGMKPARIPINIRPL